jgi:phage tail tape-measure protein
MALGRVIGGGIGAFFGGPIGVALFSMLGGVAGQAIGDKMFGDDVTSTAASANDAIYSDKEKAAAQTATLNSKVQELVDYQRAANSINSQSLTYQRDTSRNIKNLPLPN